MSYLSFSLNSVDSESGSEKSQQENNNNIIISNKNNNINKINNNNLEISSENNYNKNMKLKDKFISTFLNVKTKKKVRKTSENNNKMIEDEFINKNMDISRIESIDNEFNFDEIEEPNIMVNKFRTLVKKVLLQKKNKDWDEFMTEYERKVKEEKSLKFKMKTIFNVNSDFIIIWKSTFSAFNIIFVFIYFLKYILMELSTKKTNSEDEDSNRSLFLYHMINIMFSFEFIFSVLILIFNGGSKITYLKLPLKLYCIIPFPLEKKYIIFLIPKFFRIDLIQRLFSLIEMFINTHVGHYILNYYLKIFVTYIIDLFKILLIFGLYAHCLCCFCCYFEGVEVIKYVPSLYYSIQTFTTIGFGEQSPLTIGGLIVMIITLFLGVNFMSAITSNIRYLYKKIRDFNIETSFNEQFEFLIFQIQRSTGKVFPLHLKTLMHLFLLYRRGIAYYEIKNQNKFLFDNCRQIVIKEIHTKLFNYLKRDFSIYFENCEDDFIFKIFENMRPKMFEANKTLIKYNQRIKALYFLINGYIFYYNKNKKPVFCVFGNNLFGEYEFITQQKCNYIIKTHPKMTAFGFELRKEDWENIAKKYVISAKNFLMTLQKRKKKHNKWIEWSMSNYNKNIINYEADFEPKSYDKIIDDEKQELLMGESKDISNDIILNDREIIKKDEDKDNNNSNIRNKTLITLAKEKNEKYNIHSKEILFNISEFRKKMKNYEDKLIDFKKGLIKHFKIKKL